MDKEFSFVEWHTGKPPESGFYLVTTLRGNVRMGRYYKLYNTWAQQYTVIAWAYMPKPYQEGDKCE